MTIAEMFYTGARKDDDDDDDDDVACKLRYSLKRCNLAFQINETMHDTLFTEAGKLTTSSGTGADSSFIDFASLEALLKELRYVGENERNGTLPPLAAEVFRYVTNNSGDFIAAENGMPLDPPLKKIVGLMKPSGVVPVDDPSKSDYVHGVKLMRTTAHTRGRLNGFDGYSLKLPADRLYGIEKLRRGGSEPAILYLVVGPSDELRAGRGSGEKGFFYGPTKRSHQQSTFSIRQVGHLSVVDQSYTTLFVLADYDEQVDSVLDEAIGRCMKNTLVTNYSSMYREIAAIRLGYVSKNANVYTELVNDRNDESLVASITNVDVNVAPSWSYRTFRYNTFDPYNEIQRDWQENALKRKFEHVLDESEEEQDDEEEDDADDEDDDEEEEEETQNINEQLSPYFQPLPSTPPETPLHQGEVGVIIPQPTHTLENTISGSAIPLQTTTRESSQRTHTLRSKRQMQPYIQKGGQFRDNDSD